MINSNLNVSGLNKLREHINYVKKMRLMLTSKRFQTYIQDRCLETIKLVAIRRFATSTNTNKELETTYNENHKIRDITDKGFVIYNDFAIEKPTTHHSEGYTFSIALAFEYGTGIIGLNSNNSPSWYQYNVNDNHVTLDGEEIEGWWLDVNKNGNNPSFGESKSGKTVVTRGYEGMEIYRFSAIEIQKQLPQWVKEYKE